MLGWLIRNWLTISGFADVLSSKDKTRCRHLCCKTGIPPKAAKRRKQEATNSADHLDHYFVQPPPDIPKPRQEPSKPQRKQPTWEIEVEPVASSSASSLSSIGAILAPRKLKRVIQDSDGEPEPDEPPRRPSMKLPEPTLSESPEAPKPPKQLKQIRELIGSAQRKKADDFSSQPNRP